MYRRLPKRGFNNRQFKVRVAVVNLFDLNNFADGEEVGLDALRKKGLINGRFDAVKILGGGELRKKLKIHAHLFSASAKAKIEAAGGVVELIQHKL